MKALVCEMCGGNDLVKREGLYICQNCGTKYTLEEARKLILEGKVEVEGTVRIDGSDELKNLYELARRAKEVDSVADARKYYEMILLKDSNSWEANFYFTLYRYDRFLDLSQALGVSEAIIKCLSYVFALVRDNVPVEEQDAVINELYSKTLMHVESLFQALKTTYDGLGMDAKKTNKSAFSKVLLSLKQVMFDFGDNLEDVFWTKYSSYAVKAWKDGIRLYQTDSGKLMLMDDKGVKYHTAIMEEYANKIRKYDSGYQLPKMNFGLGCSGCGCAPVGTAAVVILLIIIFVL